MVGQRVGNYEIVQPLGEGGMAAVYVAVHPELRRRVAVKVLHPDLAHSREMVERFFNEARAASGIGHRGIVEISDLGTLPSGEPYLVMELLEGESLASRMTSQGPFPLAAAIEIATQAADVMVAAHARGIVHRDLKPENLFLIPDPLQPGRELVKVLDFGIAKLAQRPPEREGLRTRTGAILGTPRYMSPEQCRESRDVDHRADVYSLGVVLYEMLAGAPPFMSVSWVELAHMHLVVDPPALRSRASDTPAAVAEVVHRALEKDPDARFQTMAAFKNALLAAATAPSEVPTAAPSKGSAAAPSEVSTAARDRGIGSTKLFEVLPRRPRPSTLEEAAVEVVRDAPRPRRMIPVVGGLMAATAVLVVASWLALRPSETAPPSNAGPAAAPVQPAPAPPETAPPTSPPVVTAPSVEVPTPAVGASPPAPAPELGAPAPAAEPSPEAAATPGEPERAAPARRRRRAAATSKPAAPAKAEPVKAPTAKPALPPNAPVNRPGPREPFKI